ncbi:hypothetical protein BDB01DRAFT_837518 [Pilobolus umbonatus]|nr:hypothetical protein BDB01DRAFT_837518 [Pilobolus umbonatus]
MKEECPRVGLYRWCCIISENLSRIVLRGKLDCGCLSADQQELKYIMATHSFYVGTEIYAHIPYIYRVLQTEKGMGVDPGLQCIHVIVKQPEFITILPEEWNNEAGLTLGLYKQIYVLLSIISIILAHSCLYQPDFKLIFCYTDDNILLMDIFETLRDACMPYGTSFLLFITSTMSVYSANSYRAFYASSSPTPSQLTSPRYSVARTLTPVSDEEEVSYAHLFYDNHSDDSHDTVPNNSGDYSAGRSNLIQGLNNGENVSVHSRREVRSESFESEVQHEVVGPSVVVDNPLLNDYLNMLCAEQTPNEEPHNEIPYESYYAESEEIDVDDCMELDDPMDVDYPPLWWVVPMEIDNPMDID